MRGQGEQARNAENFGNGGLGLNQRDEAQATVAAGALNVDGESAAEQLVPGDVLRLARWFGGIARIGLLRCSWC